MPFDVRPLRSRDLEDALRLSTQAGWNQVAADWWRIFELAPAGCLAGELDGRVVATATVASFGKTAQWIGMVLVDESLRGRGFGSTMFSSILSLARSLGGDAVGLDATHLGRPVYLKQGFADVAPIDRWSGVLRESGPSPGLELIDRSTFDDVAALDRAACGADRSEFLVHLMNEPDVVGVTEPGLGFGFLRPGRTRAHVGPLVASDDAVASRLLSRLAKLGERSEILLDALRTPSTSAMLERHGLEVARQLTRMTFGSPQRLLMGDSVRAVVSFEWG
jgi:GNAT superfamily N-acetyltransferase